MIFQRISIPGKGQNSRILIGTVGSTPVVLERTDSGLSVITEYASVIVPAETPEAVMETAERLIHHLERRHPELKL